MTLSRKTYIGAPIRWVLTDDELVAQFEGRDRNVALQLLGDHITLTLQQPTSETELRWKVET